MPNFSVEVPLELDGVYTAFEVATAALAIVGNSLVVVMFVRYQKLRTVTNHYVISLSIADLLVGVIGIPFAIATSVGLPKNFEACLFMNSLLLLLCTGSIFSLVAVTMDRYFAILHPMTYTTTSSKSTARVVIGVSWILASVVGLLPLMGWNLGRPPVPRCFFMEVIDLKYLVFIYFITMLLPVAFLAIVYVKIYRVVREQLRLIAIYKVSGGQQAPSFSHSETKAAKSIAIIVILFVISWIPLYTINTVMCFCPSCPVPPSLLYGSIVLSHLNSAWNPALYAWGMRDFQTALKKMFRFSSAKSVANQTYNMKNRVSHQSLDSASRPLKAIKPSSSKALT